MPKTRKVKKAEAEARDIERANRSTEEQLARLDKRPGLAANERGRLGQ